MSHKNKSTPKDYFNRARTWADDTFGQLQQSRNRYQLAFVLSMGLNITAGCAIATLAHYQTLVPLLIHHYDNGVTTVEPATQTKAPTNQAQVESDLVRYISNRESYDISSYRVQFDLISLLSNNTVADEYIKEQDKADKQSPVNTLGATATRTVHIYSINFLDGLQFNDQELEKNHHNVAEVVFTLTDTDKFTSKKTEHHYNALISWLYVTPSTSPDARWQNWDGFQVVRYNKTNRHI